MDSFGEKLRYEREDQGLSIEAVSERIGADQDRLLALERNDYDALPDNEFIMRDILRAYAECLGVEADLMIEDYLREREECLQKLDDAITAQAAVKIAPSAVPSPLDRPSNLPRTLMVSGILVAVVLLGAWWMRSGDGTEIVAPEPAREPARIESLPARPAAAPTVVEQSPRAIPAEPEATRQERSAPVSAEISGPSISEYGVGTAIGNRQLIGEGRRFSQGTQVWFWTRVDNGNPGDRIDHVWLHEGVEAATVSLELGGLRWRTYSAKMLHSAGDWTVEARDEVGHVLARTEFVCID